MVRNVQNSQVNMKHKLKRYFWLIDSLKDKPMSLNKLNRKWENSILNDDKIPLSRRTFQEHRNAINELGIGIEIIYDYTTRCYSLKSDDDNGNLVSRWMWNAISLQSTMAQNANIKDRIIIEEIPSAHIYLDPILHAIRENYAIEFLYRPFGKDSFMITFYPYFIQMTDQRWYVYGLKKGEESIKTYALDRMESITLKEESFSFPKDFSAEEYLSENGIGQYENIPIVDVAIRAYGKQVELLRTLPLHPSQKEIKTEEGKSEFAYTLRPTTKFYGDILSKGKYVKVLSPYFVRKHIKEIVDKLNEYYK